MIPDVYIFLFNWIDKAFIFLLDHFNMGSTLNMLKRHTVEKIYGNYLKSFKKSYSWTYFCETMPPNIEF